MFNKVKLHCSGHNMGAIPPGWNGVAQSDPSGMQIHGLGTKWKTRPIGWVKDATNSDVGQRDDDELALALMSW